MEIWHAQMTTTPLSAPSLASVSARELARQEALSVGRWVPAPNAPSPEVFWAHIRAQSAAMGAAEPLMAGVCSMSIGMHATLASSLAFLLATKLSCANFLGPQLQELFGQAYASDPSLLEACAADLQVAVERDPACESEAQCLLFFKGFHALQVHRVAHWMWTRGRKSLALALQSRVADVFAVDIHPAARVGWGVMVDHATGVVVGETAVVGDNVSLLHQTTLGGSGTGRGSRHPLIGNGVVLGAGVSILGPVIVGAHSKVGAGSVVLTDLPGSVVAVGVPARIVRRLGDAERPSASMDQCYDYIEDYTI
ncbi:hypothetical protein H632_c785p1 [Helicosporidium sp. ATCC 50920]|nr:hypothetical protein H632_c785p1 [Helicosporidium sp. ATCC 50920]|eukprot:KDD75251.1 hypothetical protein H632_c785p1 [Helicosporidium sp. ATCC 50920]